MRKKPKNIIDLYAYQYGQTEIPPQFIHWTAISLIAACLEDRVFFRKFENSKLMANLFIMFIGPSGCGKGHAIEDVLRFTTKIPHINSYRGKASTAYLLDYMGKRRSSGGVVGGLLEEGEDDEVITEHIDHAKLYLITPELSAAVEKVQADGMIKLMCELYGGGEYTFQEGTRSHGEIEIHNPCSNWLGGSVIGWLMDVVQRDAISGGFFARAIAIKGDYNFSNRIWLPKKTAPSDQAKIRAYILARLQSLSLLEGEMKLSPKADAYGEEWYAKRKVPEDDSLKPSFKRQQDLVLKLAMILSVAESEKLIIETHHLEWAIIYTDQIRGFLPDLIAHASVTHETDGLMYLRDTIRRRRMIPHSKLLKVAAANRGMNAEKMRGLVETLIQQKLITRSKLGQRGGMVYIWKGEGNITDAED